MIRIRKGEERGHADHGWLNTHYTFSFADYYDPQHIRFRVLRVMNEDVVQPGQGFGMHSHQDMEIVTYVLEGALEHKDSMGNGEVLRPGEFQRMSAGTGIQHSEFNPSTTDPVHLYQIWLLPDRKGHEPSYEQKQFPSEGRRNQFRRVASPDGREGSLTIHQDAHIYLAEIEPGKGVSYELAPNRHAWLQILRGSAKLNNTALGKGDGAAVSEEPLLRIEAPQGAEVMLFDLP